MSWGPLGCVQAGRAWASSAAHLNHANRWCLVTGCGSPFSAEFNLHVAPWREGRPAFCFRARLTGWDFKWDSFG